VVRFARFWDEHSLVAYPYFRDNTGIANNFQNLAEIVLQELLAMASFAGMILSGA